MTFRYCWAMVFPRADVIKNTKSHPCLTPSPPHRDARDDWCSSLNEPVHLTNSLLTALILEPLLGQLLQCLLELLKGDGPAGLPSVDDRLSKSSGRGLLGPTPQVCHPFLHSAGIPTGHSQMAPTGVSGHFCMWSLLGGGAERKTGNSSRDSPQGAGGSEVAWKEPKVVVIKVGKEPYHQPDQNPKSGQCRAPCSAGWLEAGGVPGHQ